MNTWYEVKCKYTKQLEDLRLKRVTEPYLIDATSFTEAEARCNEEVGQTVRGEFDVVSIKRENIADIFDYEDAETWFKAKVKFEAIDADSGKSKAVSNTILVSAENAKVAYQRIQESLREVMSFFEITSVSLTKIVEVMPYNSES